MSGWKDVDGRNVMAGSPGVLDCLDIEFRRLLGELPHQRYPTGSYPERGLEQLIEAARGWDNPKLVTELLAAADLVRCAQRMLVSSKGQRVTLESAQRASAAMKEAAE